MIFKRLDKFVTKNDSLLDKTNRSLKKQTLSLKIKGCSPFNKKQAQP